MPDIAPAFSWSLSLLHTTDAKLPLISFQPFLNSSVRYFKALNPAVGVLYAGNDLNDDDLAAFNEALGYRAVGVWLQTPPASGFETVLKEELGNGLSESYAGWSRDKIAMALIAAAESSFEGVGGVADSSTTTRGARSYVTRARPTRTAKEGTTTLIGRLYVDSAGDEF